MKRCQKCRGLMPDDIFVCVRCGHDSENSQTRNEAPVALTTITESAPSNARKISWAKIGATVLTSSWFFLASCTTSMFISFEPARNLGTIHHMEKGQPADTRMSVIVLVPDAKTPGKNVVHQVPLFNLERFQKENPTYSFLIPIGKGEVNDIGAEMNTKYVTSSAGPGKVVVETHFFHDVPPAGFEVEARYEATEKAIAPVYTKAGSPGLFALLLGVVFACLLSTVGMILKWRLNKSTRPLVVRIALSGVKSRRGAWFAISVYIALTILFAIESWIGLFFLIPAGGAWYGMRWVDENEGWDTPKT